MTCRGFQARPSDGAVCVNSLGLISAPFPKILGFSGLGENLSHWFGQPHRWW